MTILAAAVLLTAGMTACGSTHAGSRPESVAPTPARSGSTPTGGGDESAAPTPLQSPNGFPDSEGLHGQMIPAYLWYRGHAYGPGKIIAHLLEGKVPQPLPVFLSPAGVARYAYQKTDNGPMFPGGWDTATPAYVHIGTPAGQAIVAELGLVGQRGYYLLYWEFPRT